MRFADLALARRLEASEARACADYAEVVARLAPESRATAVAVGSGLAVFAGPGGPLSRAVGLGLRGPVTAGELDRVEGFYRRLGGPSQVDVCPLADRSLLSLLGERGYRVSELNTVLVRALDPLEGFAPLPPGLDVAPAGPEEAETWAAAVAAGFAGDEEVTGELFDVALALFHVGAATAFLARVGGEVAGGGVLTIREGLAALFATSTLPAFRNRGVQTALLGARLATAAARGADLAVCYTLPGSGSQRNVERLGFGVVYTKLVLSRDLSA
ncbi:N-acetyltransferase [Acidobacteria bacterium ACD]|nr:MAG: N-acetyltransferase [Acidobacteriota bacterium]MDL1951765.1 N-acetyltransferase [Acidobacteria bacterium ACD]